MVSQRYPQQQTRCHDDTGRRRRLPPSHRFLLAAWLAAGGCEAIGYADRKRSTKKIAGKVKDMFVEQNGELRHDRLDSERKKQEDWREKSVLAGKRSAEKRATKSQPIANQTSTKVEPPLENGSNQNPTLLSSVSNLQSSSPKSTEVQIPAGDEKKLIAKPEAKVDLPWPSELFAEMWEKWKKFRAAEKRVKFKSAESELAQLKRLHTLAFGDEQTAIQIIEQSIGNQWMGLFQLPAKNQIKNTENGTGNNHSKTPLWRR